MNCKWHLVHNLTSIEFTSICVLLFSDVNLIYFETYMLVYRVTKQAPPLSLSRIFSKAF